MLGSDFTIQSISRNSRKKQIPRVTEIDEHKRIHANLDYRIFFSSLADTKIWSPILLADHLLSIDDQNI